MDRDGKLDAGELVLMYEVIFGHDEEDDINDLDDLELSAAGLDRDELELMDEDERREALENAGLDSDDFDFDDF